MSGGLSILFAVMLLTDPEELIDASAAAEIAEDADRGVMRGTRPHEEVKSARITSRSSDFDRKAGVVMFEGDVVVRYSDDYAMCADRLYMFLAGSNELHRVVAVGNVSVSNDTRTGTCAMATYRRPRSEIEMFGDGKGTRARLVESGEEASALEGARIKFWLDSEQVEVDDPTISVRQEGGKKVL